MSEHETETSSGGSTYDAPNQQVVRADGSGPSDEGTGGTPGEGARREDAGTAREGDATDLDAMTKEELLAHARSLGVSPANATMTKDELRDAIDAHEEGSAAE